MRFLRPFGLSKAVDGFTIVFHKTFQGPLKHRLLLAPPIHDDCSLDTLSAVFMNIKQSNQCLLLGCRIQFVPCVALRRAILNIKVCPSPAIAWTFLIFRPTMFLVLFSGRHSLKRGIAALSLRDVTRVL